MTKPNTRFPTNPAEQQWSLSVPAWQQLRNRGIAGQGSAAANRVAAGSNANTGTAGPRVLPQQPSTPSSPVNRTPPIVDPMQIPGPGRGDPSRGGIMSMQPPSQPGMTFGTGQGQGPDLPPGVASSGGLQMGQPGPPGMFDHPGQQLGVQGPGDAGNIDNAIQSLRSQLGQAGANIPNGAPLPGPSTKFPLVPSGGDNVTPGWSPFGGNGPSTLPAPTKPIGMRPGQPGMPPGGGGQPGSYLDLLKQRLQGRQGRPLGNGGGGGTGAVNLSGTGQAKDDGRMAGQGRLL